MDMQIVLVVLFSLVGLLSAGPAHHNPYISTCPIGGKEINNNKEWVDQRYCVKYKCQVRGPDAALLIIRCPSIPSYPRDKCTEVPGKGNFPNCCPTLKCN